MSKGTYIEKIYAYFLKTHTHEHSKNFLHVACKHCGERIKRSGVLFVPAGLYCCYQPSCSFYKIDKWHKASKYIKAIEGDTEVLQRIDPVELNVQVYKKFLSPLFDEQLLTVAKRRNIQLPEYAIPLSEGTGMLSDKARQYVLDRRYDPDIMTQMFGIHYVKEFRPDNPYYGYLILPVFDRKGKMLYYQARNFLGKEPRYRNPPIDKVHVGKESVLMNEAFLETAKVGYVTEGPFDAYRMTLPIEHPNTYLCEGVGLGNFGSNSSRTQEFKLFNSPLEDIYVLGDYGAFREALELGFRLMLGSSKRVYVNDLKPQYSASGKLLKDPDDIGKAGMIDQVQHLPPLTHARYMSELMHLVKFTETDPKTGKTKNLTKSGIQ